MTRGPLEELGDVALVEAHLAGDPEAFGVLFTRHRDRLWAVALRTTGHPEDAADALQEGMVSAYRRAESFRGESAVTTWLHRIVVNAALDRLRRNKVRAADPLPDDLDEHARRGAVVTAPEPGDGPGDPEHEAVAADRRRRVLQALDELAPEQRAALVLVDMEGYPVAEAARLLDVPSGTVKSRCARGRARLAALLPDLAPSGQGEVDHGSVPRGTEPPPAASHHGDRAPARGSPEAPVRPDARPRHAPQHESPHDHDHPRGGEQP